MGRRFILCMITILASTAAASADIVVPGTKSVTTKARFENLSEYPDYRFWVADSLESEIGKINDPPPFAPTLVDSNKTDVILNSHYRAPRQFLLAVPKKLMEGPDAKPTIEWLEGKVPGVLRTELPRGYGSAPESDPREEYCYYFRVQIRSPGPGQEPTLSLLEVSRTAPNPPPGPTHWLIAGGVGLMALVMILGWLFFIRKAKKKVSAEEPAPDDANPTR